jgi:hypothetical protein
MSSEHNNSFTLGSKHDDNNINWDNIEFLQIRYTDIPGRQGSLCSITMFEIELQLSIVIALSPHHSNSPACIWRTFLV